MRIESVSRPAGSDQAPHAPPQALPGVSAHARTAVDDEVELHTPPQPAPGAGLDLAMLQALIEGLLERLAGHPVRLSPLIDAASRYGNEAPAWITTARQALNRPGHGLLRIEVSGCILPAAAEALPFALDLQLPNLFQIRATQTLTDRLVPAWPDASLGMAEVEFSLQASAEADLPAAIPSGGPLFVRAALAGEMEVRELAARVLPLDSTRQIAPRAVLHGDEHFVTTAALADNRHDLDISA